MKRLLPLRALARWNGSAWSALGSGIPSPYDVYSLTASGGEVFVGGDFPSAGGVTASRIARWDGSTWSALGSGTDNVVYAMATMGGALYAGGAFLIAGGKVSAYVAKANLSAPPPTLTLGGATSITTVGATLNGTVNPNGAVTTAQFEYGQTISYGAVASVTLSPNDGSSAQAVSAPITGLTPGTLYHFRLTATNAGGASATSDGTFTTTGIPEITLHNGASTGAPQLTDGQAAAVDFGYTAQGTAVTRDFTISNTGTAPLTVGSITAPSGYTVLNAPGAAIAAAATHTFQVRLDAAGAGTFSGSVTVNSNDSDEAAFDFPVTGIVQNAPFHNWAAGSGLSGTDLAPTANPAGDGVENLLKYAFNMNPAVVDVGVLAPGTGTSGLPAYSTTGSGAASFYRYEFIRRIGSGLVYTPKKSPDLAAWSNLTSTPTVTPIDANWERVVHLEPFGGTAIEELFGMVEVTLP